MEVMEEGDLMDRVPILLQRDMQYYQTHQTVLQESICLGVVGGKLDFPRSASFAAVKIVNWWEDEYYAAYRKNSGLLHLDELDEEVSGVSDEKSKSTKLIVKASNPEKFVFNVARSADHLLEHLHTLSQEALDHADLSVLTATIGAAALVKNALQIFLQSVTVAICPPKGEESGGSLKMSYKQYSELTEALAERLHDLHCRLLMLYIMQDADCLFWESDQPFFESERGSFTIQMWWNYMKGTKEDLWNSVPPAMAQRVFAGMLNDTLSILAVRYTQCVPSPQRAPLLLVDVNNILLCVAELLPSICDDSECYLGINIKDKSKIIRDIHCKCNELFICLLLRGAPLGVLYKIFRKGLNQVKLLEPQPDGPYRWILFALVKQIKVKPDHYHETESGLNNLTSIALELKVFLSAPQINWSLLLKLLLMRNATLTTIIMKHLMQHLPSMDCFIPTLEQPLMNRIKFSTKCMGFLCGKECNNILDWLLDHQDPVGQSNYQIVLALCYLLLITGHGKDFIFALSRSVEQNTTCDWASCLDKRQVWSQKRPPWYEAIMQIIYPVADSIVPMLIAAVQTGASMYQAMSLSISCFTEMWDCIPHAIYTVAMSLTDLISADVHPLGDSMLIQILYSALYTKLFESSETANAESNVNAEKTSICLRLSEAICSIDEENKHTDQLSTFLEFTAMRFNGLDQSDLADGFLLDSADFTESVTLREATDRSQPEFDVEAAFYVPELLSCDALSTSVGKQSLKVVYSYLQRNTDWLMQQLDMIVDSQDMGEIQTLTGQSLHKKQESLLMSMFHIGHQPFDSLLIDGMKLDYFNWLQKPMSMTAERVWLHLSNRPEFQENSKLSMHDTVMKAFLVKTLDGTT